MIAVIAGTGFLPIEACKSLLSEKKQFFVIALFPEDNVIALQKATQQKCEIIAESAYRCGAVLDLLKQKTTKQVLLIGKVDKRALLKKIKLDWLSIKMLASVVYKSDATLMEKILSEFASHGIEVLKQDHILRPLLVPPGVLTGSLSPALEKDICLGIQTAKNISALDIGQTVIIKDTMILAVEAIEGTDECIQRGISLGKQDIVICKAAQPLQNKKFDLPTLGPKTLTQLSYGQVKAIAWDSEHTLISERDRFIQKAKTLGITLVSV